tara:strand:+ start:413 stop:1822 length:1410 start_codon:yes stop_codon:yes gene_type:complete
MAISQSGNNAVPAPNKVAVASNYLDFATAGQANWSQQFLPDLIEEEAEAYGKRTISGFLAQVGAEESMTSDQVVWSEQGRLHLKYSGAIHSTTNVIDGLPSTHAIRLGDTIVISCPTKNKTYKAYVSDQDTSSTSITVAPYTVSVLIGSSSGQGGLADNDVVDIFVYGSEFTKGTNGRGESISPQFKSFSNKPIILKDKYHVNGSDTSQIGWVEVTGEAGQSGYLWYLKAEGDTKSRFTDYLEMSMVEAVKKGTNGAGGAPEGSEGLFAAIEERGILANGVAGSSASDDLAEFDLILKELDKQGAIEENMLYLNRDTALAIDDMLAAQNSYGSGGTSFGVFSNSEDMALNLGFSGFRRGSYDFYKTDWKYLNDSMTRGAVAAANTAQIRGVFIPAGVSSVYDEQLGKNLKRPFLHTRYRASQADDRRMKSWITGSVGGNITSDLDAMEVHYLSERCLVVQGANNFVMLN